MLEFIKNIFKKDVLLDEKATNNLTNISFGKPTDNEVNELLKKATSFKTTDIEQAISLIKSALKIDPDFPCYDKLTNYLIIANRTTEAEEIFLRRINEFKSNDNLFNFQNRASNYERYSNFIFKKGLYKEYIFFYCLSIYNYLIASAIGEQIETIRIDLKNEDGFNNRKINKCFQEIGMLTIQDLFIETFYSILKDFKIVSLCNLVINLKNKQIDKENIEIEGYKMGKTDWLLWSNKEFIDTIFKFEEQIFIGKYNTKLEILLLAKD